jgi:hypothetical protein
MLIFWAFKLSFVVDNLAFLGCRLFGLLFEKLGEFFSNLLVTLMAGQQSMKDFSEQGDKIGLIFTS